VIFIDTSAIYALADRADANHRQATALFRAALDADERFLTHNYVVVESMSLLQHRLGLASALTFARDANRFDLEWITPAVHEAAVQQLTSARRRRLSFVDATSFLVMRSRDIEVAFAFDSHFVDEGFRLFELPPR
jgi:predicted nucleic acid-binding protein